MLIAGEASGDLLAAELVNALREGLGAAESVYTSDLQPLRTGLEPRFFGAGGPRLKAAGVELAFDLTRHSVIGIFDAVRFYPKFRRLFHQLFALAVQRQPDVIIGVDYGEFNLRFAHAIRRYVRARHDWFHGWQPRIVKYISPQVWASRPGRAYRLAKDHDLLLSIFPFEKEWYAERVPDLRVEFVGHPLVEQLQNAVASRTRPPVSGAAPGVLLLPGSRKSELYRHLPVMFDAVRQISAAMPARWRIVLPNETLSYIVVKCLLPQLEGQKPRVAVSSFLGAEGLEAARTLARKVFPNLEIQIGHLPEALAEADIAIAKTGTVATECACAGVPAVTLYRAAWREYLIARPLVKVKWLTMPNLLANEEIFPEFLQSAATPENISRAALELLQNEPRRAQIKKRLSEVLSSLGGPGANRRAAQAIVRLLETGSPLPQRPG